MDKRVSRIGKYLLLLLAALSSSSRSFAQADSAAFFRGSARATRRLPGHLPLSVPGPVTYRAFDPPGLPGIHPFNEKSFHFDRTFPDFRTSRMPLSKGEYRVSGIIRPFRSGAWTGSGEQINLIGIGTVNYVALAYHHRFNDRLTGALLVNTTQLRSPFFPDRLAGLSGTFSYTIRENLTLHTFGTYETDRFYRMNFGQYGATLRFDMTDRFGTEIGVRRSYDPYRKRWDTTPVFMPYYRFDQVTIEMDFGGILQEMLLHWIR